MSWEMDMDMGGGGRGGGGRGRGGFPPRGRGGMMMGPAGGMMMGGRGGRRSPMEPMMRGYAPPPPPASYGRGQRFRMDDYNSGAGYDPYASEDISPPRGMGGGGYHGGMQQQQQQLQQGPHVSSQRLISPSKPQRPMGDMVGDPRSGGPGPALPPASGGPPPAKAPAKIPKKFANDCEIIVTAKQQQAYAELIEKAIRNYDLKVDLMFPKPDVKLGTFIDNIASMGTIFAIVIRPDNEAHRSVSVHVLRGTVKPEEHRNMPLAAAYDLIRNKYTELKRKEIGTVPPLMKDIFENLQQERMITDTEYVDTIKFLQERRRKQKAFENRTNNVTVDSGLLELIKCPEADELQVKIMSILNGEIKPEGARESVNLSSKEPKDGDKSGKLMVQVPLPTEPLGALNTDSKVESAINTLMDPSFISNLNAATSTQMPSSRGGYGRGYSQY